MRVLVTGTAGFIGSHVAHQLLNRGDDVLGLDNVNDYYDVTLKEARLSRLLDRKGFTETRISLEDKDAVAAAFSTFQPQRVIHLAAQAGVRYSLENPSAYINTNIVGFLNILEPCRHHQVEHLVYASSSSVYGANTQMPFSVHHNVDHPLSLYAATKKSNELMAHTYSNLFNLPTTGLRFFTVYGPWGRPDMALFIFARNILEGKPIQVFNRGQHKRDFTYIDDIVNGVVRLSDHVATPNAQWQSLSPDPATSKAPYRVFNIGNNQPVELMRFIEILETALGKKAEKEFLPMQPGDVPATCADIDALSDAVGYRPDTPVETGVNNFVQWYRDFYQV
ncbi:MAG: NAD-dependent epimerase [Lysobacterales bacterium]